MYKKMNMEQEEYRTEYDGLVQTRELQMLKSMLPFISVRSQLPIALLIQTMEFQNTMRVFGENKNALSACTINNETDRRSAMMQIFRKFCTPKERETLDNMMNIMCVMENYENFPL